MNEIFLSADRARIKEKVNVIANACLDIEMQLSNYMENTFDDDELVRAHIERVVYEALDLAEMTGSPEIAIYDIDGDELYE